MNKVAPLWTPSKVQTTNSRLTEFARWVENRVGKKFADYEVLHTWSCEPGGEFWDCLWDFCNVVGEKGQRIIDNEDQMPGAVFFPNAKLNYAQNLLKYSDDTDAMVFRCENKVENRINRTELRDLVSRLQQALADAGVGIGDRVAAMMPNMPETIAMMLAASSLGAIWSSCSPDFGAQGVLDRFGQISPKVLITCDGYWYNGKRIDISDKLYEITSKLQVSKSVIVPLVRDEKRVATRITNGITLEEFIGKYEPTDLHFEMLDFSHPLFILFSSGTTGIPKCIVHSQGGMLLQQMKEHQLHANLREGDNLFYYTTCGWMMWNWLATGLASGATLMLYDGSPFAEGPETLFDYADQEQFSVFGTSAKYIDAVRISGLKPIESHDLSSINMICSTGSPLAPENFEFVYTGIKNDVHLASMSGGTDIGGCFVMGIPWHPVYMGEIQGPAMGMSVEVWDDQGEPLSEGKGELVCTRAFPSMPIRFWNDDDGSKYHAAYFDRFDNIWCHGDFAQWTPQGGMIIHGRSDATLNPGGVRIGTAEIYNQVEQLDEVEEGLCIGQQWEGDVRIVLFVKMATGIELDEELEKRIRNKIRSGASPRHVPARIVAVDDIPRTKSGKITELAVRDVVHGHEVKNKEALANPESLELFKDLPQLQG